MPLLRIKMVRKDYDEKTQHWIRKQVPARVVEYMNAVAVEIQTEVKKVTPVDTGHLQRNWFVRFSNRIQTPARVYNNVFYGPYVEYGTERFAGRFFTTLTKARAPSIAAKVQRRFARGRS